MTLLNSRTIARPGKRRTLPKPVTAEDFENLYTLAEELNGRPVPGVRMTEAQFDHWCDEDVRAEWVDGEVIIITTSSVTHGDINGWLLTIIRLFVDHHDLGSVLGPELTVRLGEFRRKRVPDLVFIAKSRLTLLRETYLEGAPDLAIEVVSTDSVVRDWQTKYFEYQKAGVREYWVVDTLSNRVEAYALRGGEFKSIPLDPNGNLRSKVLRGFFLKPAWLLGAPLPKMPAVLKTLGLR